MEPGAWQTVGMIVVGVVSAAASLGGARYIARGNSRVKRIETTATPYDELADRTRVLERVNRALNKLVGLWEAREYDWQAWGRDHAPGVPPPPRDDRFATYEQDAWP